MKRQLAHVACVDDDPDILFIVEVGLEAAGNLEVTLINGPAQAPEKLVEASPDVILLDVMMPVTDGPTLLREIHHHPVLSGTPVIFMTARVQPAEVAHYMALGAIGVISKPFDVLNLAEEIRTIWDRWSGQTPMTNLEFGERRPIPTSRP